MSQVTYLILVFIISFIMSYFYFVIKSMNSFIKLITVILLTFLFSFICYQYNYFILNEYVILTILYAVYVSYLVKTYVKKKKKLKK